MKKTLVILSALLLTGCGNKIVCKTTDGAVTEKDTIKYKQNEITKITTVKTYSFEDKEEFEEFEGIIQYGVKAGTSKNTEASYKKKNKKYILTQIYNVSDMDQTELDKLAINKNKDEYVKNLENSGLTCK
jgi:Cft2 family RNA processing exonuclease